MKKCRPIEILPQNEKHFSGELKPWDDRILLPTSFAIARVFVFALLLVAGTGLWVIKLEIYTLLLVNAAFVLYTTSQQEKFYRIGFFDGVQSERGSRQCVAE